MQILLPLSPIFPIPACWKKEGRGFLNPTRLERGWIFIAILLALAANGLLLLRLRRLRGKRKNPENLGLAGML